MGDDERKQRYKTRSRSRERDESRLKPKKSHKRSSGSESDSDDSYNKSKKSRHHRSYSPSPDRFGKSAPKKKRRSESSDSGSNSDSSPDRHKSKSKKKKHRRSRSRSKEKKHKPKKKTRSDSPQRSLTSEELMRLKEKRKVEKEQQKLLETAEEKRARRLAKKEAKEKKMKMKMGWDDEYMEYTNGDNPFGDEHLLDTFVWGKKLEKEGKHNLAQIELETLQKKKMIENKIELEKVKKRRMEREREMEEREREREAEQRDKEAEYYREWEKQEDHFHLNQAKLRSKIRILDGRAKPIDLLAKYISAEDDDLAIEMHEPYTYLNGLTITDLEDLLEDIKVYVELEAAKNIDYWRDITVITEDELGKLRKIDPNSKDYLGERRSGINSSVEGEVHATFKGKTLEQLNMLEKHIRAKLTSGESVDVGYWESLLQQLRAHVARTRLRERHQDQLRRKLFKLKEEQGIESAPLFPIVKDEGTPDASAGTNTLSSNMGPPPNPQPRPASPKPGTSGTSTQAAVQSAGGEGDESDGEEEEDNDESILKEEDLTQQPYDDYDAGSYSPKLLRPSELEPDTIVYDPEDDIKRLEYARQRLIRIGQAKEETDREFEKRAREGMTDDEATFSVEVPLEKQTLLWSDKYRPRKPRFFNRVHTGFEWNKYNQTHYDIDNPPPKIVQGYKFNIFYPDLIDKTKTPEYTLTPCEDNRDFAVLKFHAGPPYEDIAFKIVNREWEYSYKRGFRCQFHNNIFQLWYHFKRYRYRR